ncbi:hypothetical protein VTJ49DRAFT_4569 [Mycothermus thermophilus]|uniref:Ankyrin n=1 Tax=Humicola insolens TaxID=85995 RepID=A0ABR3VNC2_HUMIN
MDPGDGRPRKQRWKLLGAFKSAIKSSSSNTKTSRMATSGPTPARSTIQSGAVPDKPRRLYSIHDAVRDRNIQQIREILKAHPCDIYLTDDQGMTPLTLSVLLGSLTVAKFLYDSGASLLPEDNNDESLLCLAVAQKNIPMITWLAALRPPGIDRSEFLDALDLVGNSALHYSVGRNLLEITRILLVNGADPNVQARHKPDKPSPGTDFVDGGTPLLYAAGAPKDISSQDTIAMVKLLMRHGAATNIPERINGTFPLHHAMDRNDPALIDAIVDGPHDPSLRAPVDVGIIGNQDKHMQGTTALMHAAALGKRRAVKHLILRGADPNRVNSFGETCLHWAAGGHDEPGPDADTKRNERLGPPMVRMLVLGTDVGINDDEDDNGNKNNDTDDNNNIIIDDVVEDNTPTPRWATCNINATTNLGSTPLHAAAWLGRLNTAKTLLKLGADPFIVAEGIHIETVHDVRGTPVEYARLKGHFEVAEVIEGWERELKKKRKREREEREEKAAEEEKGSGS